LANQDAISSLIVHFKLFRAEQLSDKSVDRGILGYHFNLRKNGAAANPESR
jgi:hypothetical protein